MTANENTIGNNIKRIRKAKKITQKELGEMLGVSQSAINQFENNRSTPKTQTLEKIAQALNVSVSTLMGFDLFNFELEKNPKIIELFAGTGRLQSLHGEPIDITKEQIEETKKRAIISLKDKCLSYFNDLNDTGKEKAIEQIELLTKIPEYKKDSGNDNQNQE